MRIIPLLVLLAMILSPVDSPAAFKTVDTTLTMSDGVGLAVTYLVPSTPGPAAGFPGILITHGFGGSRADYLNYGIPQLYADSGYLVVLYTVRGQGDGLNASGGTFSWFTGRRERDDMRELLTWMRNRSDVNPDRIAAEGGSQGGLLTWGCAAENMPVRCIVPELALPDLSRALFGNGCMNNFFAVATVVVNLTKPANYPFINDTVFPAFQNDYYDYITPIVKSRDFNGSEANITVPVFLQLPGQDDLFSEMAPFTTLGRISSPKKLFVWYGMHSLPGDTAIEHERRSLTLRFYRRWLRDDMAETIMHPDSAITWINPVGNEHVYLRMNDTASYRPERSGVPPVRLYLNTGGRLTPDSPAGIVADWKIYLQLFTSDAMAGYLSPVFTQPFTMISSRAHIIVNSTGYRYQGNLLLWDFDTLSRRSSPITRGTYQVRVKPGEFGRRHLLEYDLTPQIYTILPGHKLLAYVKFGIQSIPTKNESVPYEFGHIPYSPREDVTDTVISTPAEPSYIEVFPFVRPSHPARAGRDMTTSPEVRIAANPVHAGKPVVADITGIDTRADLTLTDMAGREITRLGIPAGQSRVRIPTDGLPAGTYLLGLHHGTVSRTIQILIIP